MDFLVVGGVFVHHFGVSQDFRVLGQCLRLDGDVIVIVLVNLLCWIRLLICLVDRMDVIILSGGA